MCGILGHYQSKRANQIVVPFQEGLDCLIHRGPDDKGSNAIEFLDLESTLILGQTRLSIIDLSSSGHQPLFSHDKRYVIVFNGEIYNYRELRDELCKNGVSFRTETDTEVLLNAWIIWGEGCLNRLTGMFAFAICDIKKKKLFIARDAFGIKPLYLTAPHLGIFSFGSELPALLKLIPDSPRLNTQTAINYLLFGRYDNSNQTFFDGIESLSPGHFLDIDLVKFNNLKPVRWWWPSIQENTRISYKSAVELLREKFLYNIKLHLRSDVPLGAALSGGIDSSAVVCAMRVVEKDQPIHTFSYVAKGSDLDEEKWVNFINEHIGAIPHKIYVHPKEMLNDLNDMIKSQGEPFGSTSIYAQYRVFKHAKESGITVTLDGQGADELLAGYSGYPHARMKSLIELGEYSELVRFAVKWSKWPGRNISQSMRLLFGQIIPEKIRKTIFLSWKSQIPNWIDQEYLIAENLKINALLDDRQYIDSYGRQLVNTLRNSLSGIGLQNLLRHGDRNSMRWSIESRVPFLTTDMAEFLLSLPENFLISKNGETKRIFREAMRGIVPDRILDRKDKIGFATPEKEWFSSFQKESLNQWLEPMYSIPFLKSNNLNKVIEEQMINKSGRWDLWRIVNFCRWVQLFNVKIN